MSDDNIKKSVFRWLPNPEQKGERLFTFDGEQIFSLFQDYPHALTPEQKAEFDEKNPFWKDFFCPKQ